MAPKNINVYSVAELETLDRKDLLQLQENVAEALSASQERAMQELRDKLTEAGIDAAEFAKYIGAKVVTNTPADSDDSAPKRGGGRGKKDADPALEAFKQEFAGKVIINPTGGKDYKLGTRGAFPGWVRERMADIRAGKIDVQDAEEYDDKNTAPVPGEVTPEAAE